MSNTFQAKHVKKQEHKWNSICLLIALFAVFWAGSISVSAQATASLSGTVTDTSGAVIPGAKITLTNISNRDVRKTVSNGSGYFTFQALNAATYTLTVEANNFQSWKMSNLELHPGDNKSLASIALQIGAPEVTVQVDATSGELIQDSGQLGSVISADDLKRLSTEGRSATELIKMLPGMAVTGNLQNTGYDPSLSGIANSAVNNFSSNGNPVGAIQETLNGGNIIDPGEMGGSEATMNMDMVQEINVQTADFGADSARGPVVINAVTKSGSSSYHGEAYLYSRYYTFNSVDRQIKSVSASAAAAAAAKPQDKYYYPGGNIGGPIKIPGTDFNRGNKLTFFAGYEYLYQVYPGPLLSTIVPSDDMRNGDFSAAALSKICSWNSGYSSGTNGTGPLYCAVPTYMPDGTPIVNGQLTSSMMDPGGLSIYKLFPHANATPTVANSGANYINQIVQNQNGWQFNGRIDYNWNDNNKFYISYNRQAEDNQMPVNLYWIPANSVPYPGNVVSNSSAHAVSLNYTRIFSPSLTNEAIASFTYYNTPFAMTNPSAVSRSGLGFPYGTVFNTGAKVMPSVVDWVNGGYPQLLMPGGFDQGPVFARKPDYLFQDNVSKLLGQHSTKFGFFYELQTNNQINSALTQGQYQFYPWAYEYGSLGALNGWSGCNASMPNPVCFNPDADILMGAPDGYNEQNKIAGNRMDYKTVAVYGQDEWKATKRFTLTVGVRFEHLGPWTDTHGIGMAVWDPTTYAAEVGTRQTPGLHWHAIDKSLPLSGVTGIPVFYVNPRFGIAYDVYGDGRTVIRGGWGAYRFQDSANSAGGALGTAQQITSVSVSQAFNMKDVTNFTAPSGFQPNTTVTGTNLHDHERATTYDYNFTVTQQLPWRSVFQVSYVGNQTVNQLIPGINGNLAENVNAMPRGTIFNVWCNKDYPQLSGPNCQPLMSNGSQASYGSLTTTQMNQMRPYGFYQQVNYVTHGAKSNYNALQVMWNRQKGSFIWGANYTWSKALGVMGYEPDQTNYKNNYGPLPTDRSHIFNINYSWQEGRLYRGNKLLGGLINEWEISGITGIQSGPNLQAIYNTSFGFGGTVPNPYPNGGKPLSNTTLLGTPDINLQPILTCNPSVGLHSSSGAHQFINQNCFTIPDTTANYIQNGPFWWPYLHGPAYMSNDLSVYKNLFHHEAQNVQLRISAFNFLNHALVAFNPSNTNNLSMSLNATANDGGTKFADFLANPSFGYTNYSSGRRIVEFGAKYSF